MSAMPANPDALAFSPLRDVAPDSIDATGDLVTRYAWVLDAGP
jgi:hypothetical protein